MEMIARYAPPEAYLLSLDNKLEKLPRMVLLLSRPVSQIEAHDQAPERPRSAYY